MKGRFAACLFSAVIGLVTMQSTSVFASDLSTPRFSSFDQSLQEHMDNRDSSFTIALDNTTNEDVGTAISNVLSEDDYLRYILWKYNYSENTSNSGQTTVSMNVTYLETKAQSDYVNSKVAQILKQIIKPGMTDLAKETAIHNYIVSNIAYDTTMQEHSAYAALAKGKTVCQGFALLTYKMLQGAGIPVRIIDGVAGGEAHVWNLVEIGGRWYHLDTTWDDPVPFMKGRILYNFFNLTDAQIAADDHTWTNDANYPVVASTDFLQTLASTNKNGVYNSFLKQPNVASQLSATKANSFSDLVKTVQKTLANRPSQFTVLYHSADGQVQDDISRMLSTIAWPNHLRVINYSLSSTRTSDYVAITFNAIFH